LPYRPLRFPIRVSSPLENSQSKVKRSSIANALPVVVFTLHPGGQWKDVRNLLAQYRRQLSLMFRTPMHEECGLRICALSALCGISQLTQSNGHWESKNTRALVRSC